MGGTLCSPQRPSRWTVPTQQKKTGPESPCSLVLSIHGRRWLWLVPMAAFTEPSRWVNLQTSGFSLGTAASPEAAGMGKLYPWKNTQLLKVTEFGKEA